MLRGIGIDIVEITRIRKLLDSYGTSFLQKVFTEGEISYCSEKAHPEIHFAGRWAAKEAFYKALPDTLQASAGWKSIAVLPGSGQGRPVITLQTDDFSDACRTEGISCFHLSISHERMYCTAVVAIE